MTEPRRWLDDREISGELRNVLEAASAPPPLPSELDAQLSAYAAGLASQTLLAKVGGVSLAHKLWLAVGSSSKSLVLLSFIGTVAIGIYTAGPSPQTSKHGQVSSRSPAVVVARASANVAASPSEAPPVPPPSEASSATALAERAAPDATSRAAREAANAQPSASASSAESSIVEEAKLLETARSFLGDSPALALELTAQHQKLYPSGQLSAEREFVAIEALLRLGRRQEAVRRAAPRLEQSPDSLYARRLRELLAPVERDFHAEPSATPKADNQ
jgi:hypothetical protein